MDRRVPLGRQPHRKGASRCPSSVWSWVFGIWNRESGNRDALQCDSRWYAHFTLNFHLLLADQSGLPACLATWSSLREMVLKNTEPRIQNTQHGERRTLNGWGCVDFHRFSRHFDCFIVALSARRGLVHWRPTTKMQLTLWCEVLSLASCCGPPGCLTVACCLLPYAWFLFNRYICICEMRLAHGQYDGACVCRRRHFSSWLHCRRLSGKLFLVNSLVLQTKMRMSGMSAVWQATSLVAFGILWVMDGGFGLLLMKASR